MRHPSLPLFSQNHRITAWSGLEGTSVGHPVQPPAQAGSPSAGCTGPCPSGSGISPEKETPQPPWAAWARAPSPSDGRSCCSALPTELCAPGCPAAAALAQQVQDCARKVGKLFGAGCGRRSGSRAGRLPASQRPAALSPGFRHETPKRFISLASRKTTTDNRRIF